MGISDDTPGSGVDFDCSAGTIVWVRRRNGSWWPGKILGTDDLSPSHLMSPRSGTPVKLLGREDASVDWYNLEKSKRVKPFRCGEFDDCIEKAEKSHGVLIRKREKYARREDAILHALEIEREQLEKKQKKLVNVNSASNKKPRILKKTLAASSERLGNGDCKFVNLRSHSLTNGLDSSLKEENIGNPLSAQRGIHGKQSSGDEDKSEAIPRMRGLQDFGLRIAPKRKALASVISEGSRRPSLVDNHVHALSSGSRSLGGTGPVTTSKNLLGFKRKKTQGGLVEESLVKRRDRRRPLVQVLQSSAKLAANHTSQSHGDISPSMPAELEQSGVICRAKRSRCIYLPAESNDSLDRTVYLSDEMQISPSQFGIDNCHLNPGSLTEENTTSGLMDEAECSSSESDPDMDKKQAVLSVSIQHTQPMAGPNYACTQQQTESMSCEELGEAAAVDDYMSCYHSHDQAASPPADVGVSKWQLKGKRNARNLMKRPMDKGGKISNGPIQEVYLEGKGNWSNQTALGQRSRYHVSEALGYNDDEDEDEDEDEDDDEDEVIEKNPMRNQVPGFGNRRYPSMLKEMSKDRDRSNTDMVDSDEDSVWERDGLSQAPFRGYWDESGECYDPVYAGSRLGNGKDSMLVNVDLKVQSSYQGEHVPLVSLMSRLNGKAIIGHPIQIEALEDGFSDVFLFTNNNFSEEPIYNDGSTALPPVWRTARRTAMHRIPRPHPSTALNGDYAGDPLQYSDPESKPQYNKSHALHTDQIAGKTSDVCRPTEKKCPKKPIRKISLPGQKTRTLSSIATEQRLNGKGGSRKVVNSGLDGLIKPENGPPTVTCIPVKLVFSRLLEAVGRPPYRPANHIISANGDTERKQLQDPI